MSSWIFLISMLALPATLGWVPDVAKLTESELNEINRKCSTESAETSSQTESTVLEKQAASNGQYPFMAFIGNGDQFLCGAVFISQRHLLTVRDCLRMSNRAGFHITLYTGGLCYGENNTRCDEKKFMKEIPIDLAVYDSQDLGTDIGNLAIVQILDGQFPRSLRSSIDFACLLNMESRFPTSATVVGWGRIGPRLPPRYLLEAPIELSTSENEDNFFGLITSPKELWPQHEDEFRNFTQLGPDSSAGNAVVGYSGKTKRYTLYGLLLESSWSGRFGRTVVDGIKTSAIHAELCSYIGLCMPAVDRISAIPRLNMTTHNILPGNKTDERLLAELRNIRNEDLFDEDVVYCNNSGVSVESAFSKDELVTINDQDAIVELYRDQSENTTVSILQFDVRSSWDGPDATKREPQLMLKVCPPELKPGEYSSRITLCWNTPYATPMMPIHVQRHVPRRMSAFFKCNDYNYAVSFWARNEWGKGSINVTWRGPTIEAGRINDTLSVTGPCEPCCNFPLIHSPRFADDRYEDRYNAEYFADWNITTDTNTNLTGLSFPMVKLEKGFNVDNIKIKVVALRVPLQPTGTPPSPRISLYSDYAYPCFYKWKPTKEANCFGHGAEEKCTVKYIVDHSQAQNRKETAESIDTSDDALTETEARRVAEDAVRSTVTESMQESIKEWETKTTATIEATIGGSDPLGIFSAKIGVKVSGSMAEKTTDTLSKGLKNSFDDSKGSSMETEMAKKKKLRESIDELHGKINDVTNSTSSTIERVVTSEGDQRQQMCQLVHHCYGREVETDIVNIFRPPDAKN